MWSTSIYAIFWTEIKILNLASFDPQYIFPDKMSKYDIGSHESSHSFLLFMHTKHIINTFLTIGINILNLLSIWVIIIKTRWIRLTLVQFKNFILISSVWMAYFHMNWTSGEVPSDFPFTMHGPKLHTILLVNKKCLMPGMNR